MHISSSTPCNILYQDLFFEQINIYYLEGQPRMNKSTVLEQYQHLHLIVGKAILWDQP